MTVPYSLLKMNKALFFGLLDAVWSIYLFNGGKNEEKQAEEMTLHCNLPKFGNKLT